MKILFIALALFASASSAQAADFVFQRIVYVGSWSNGMMFFIQKQTDRVGLSTYSAFRQYPGAGPYSALTADEEDCKSVEAAVKAGLGSQQSGSFSNPNFSADLCAMLDAK